MKTGLFNYKYTSRKIFFKGKYVHIKLQLF